MNPNNFEQAGISLPPPSVGAETLSPGQQKEASNIGTPEIGSRAPSPVFSARAQQPANPTPQLLVNTPTDSRLVQQPSRDDTRDNPLTAGDADHIEKEWVSKTKQVIYSTREDPAAQAKQVNYVKADYLKKRFNKDLDIKDQ